MAEISSSIEGEEPEIEIDLNEDATCGKGSYACDGWTRPS